MLLGHETVARQLWAAAASGSLHHALLLEGPAGVGKMTLARRLARALNCESQALGAGADVCPCDDCPSCRAILAGSHPDVLTIAPAADSASGSISVDSVREVSRQIGYHRYGARERLVLVDPADALQEAAANALLKTLEEPPAGTRFILISTNASALLPTIRSRCQQVRLGPIAIPALTQWLAGRGLAEPEVLARLSGGCPGTALALADNGLAERRQVADLVLSSLSGDLGTVLAASQSLGEAKRSGRVPLAIDVLEELLRDALIAATGAELAASWPERSEVARAWGAALWPGGIATLSDAVAAARAQLRVNVPGRLVLDALLTAVATELGAARKAARA